MTTYLVIGLCGLVLLTLSLVAADVLDGLFDAVAGDWFSTAVIGGFVSAFGFGGALADGLGMPLLVSLPVGVVAGVGFAGFASWLTRLVRGGSSGATVEPGDIVGHDATVLTDIPAGGFGTIRVRVGEQTLQYNARAEEEVAAGTSAHVTGVLSPTAVTVAPTWTALP